MQGRYQLDGQLSISDLELLQARFFELASRGGKSAQFITLAEMIQGIGLPLSSMVSHALVSAFDRSGRGNIIFVDFVWGMKILTAGTDEERHRCIVTFGRPSIFLFLVSFRIFDTQKSGRLYRPQFAALLSSTRILPTLSLT